MERFLKFLEERAAWSLEKFGPVEHRGPRGPLDHLKKEAQEAYDEADPVKRREEIADCLFLVLDAAQWDGMTFGELVEECFKKLAKNKGRDWPDWRTTPADKAIEHDRAKDIREGWERLKQEAQRPTTDWI